LQWQKTIPPTPYSNEGYPSLHVCVHKDQVKDWKNGLGKVVCKEWLLVMTKTCVPAQWLMGSDR